MCEPPAKIHSAQHPHIHKTHTCALLLPPYSVQCGEGNLSILWWGKRVQMRGETEVEWGVGRCCHTPALSRKPQLSLRPPHIKYYSTPPSLSFLFHHLWESSSQTPTQVFCFIFFFFCEMHMVMCIQEHGIHTGNVFSIDSYPSLMSAVGFVSLSTQKCLWLYIISHADAKN